MTPHPGEVDVVDRYAALMHERYQLTPTPAALDRLRSERTTP